MIFYEPHERDRTLLPHDPFKAIVAPRPIGWVSTIGPDGATNLAPYSFFNAVCDSPPTLMFSSSGMKDSAAFAIAGGEFVWNLPTFDLREAMNTTSQPLDRGDSEFDLAGLETAPSRLVAPPRVAASPVALECVVTQTLRLRDRHDVELDQHVVFGEVVGVHLDEAFVLDDGRLDTAAMRPIMRAGYTDEYAVVERMFHLARPS